MNTLKIQIKPYYQNNPFNLKDDQIHCLSTNKDEEEIQLLLKQMNLSNYTVFLQLDMENYTYVIYIHHLIKNMIYFIIMTLIIMKTKLNLAVLLGLK